MKNIVIAFIVAIVSAASLWGWGWAARRCSRGSILPHSLTVAVGLATVLFLGGILNLAGMIHPFSLDAIVIIGLVLTLAGLRSAEIHLTPPSRNDLIASIPVLLTGWFVASYLMPQAVFNIHDDFEKYFVYPVKMLATGSLPPSPLSALGAETLGGQAFLQTFVVSHFPLVYLGAVDSFFCLLLCVVLAGFAMKPGPWGLGALAAELSVLAIDPQMANCSSVFSGSALVMAVIFLAGFPASPGQGKPSALLLGLVYAGIITLKSTFVVFVGLHFLTFFAAMWIGGNRRLAPALAVGGWTLFFAAPWLLVHLPLYLKSLSAVQSLPPDHFSETLNYFSSQQLFYGATQLHYTALALAGLTVGMFIFIATRRGWLRPSSTIDAVIAASVTTGVAYFVMIGGLGPLLYGRDHATRYLCPIIVAAVPALIRQVETIKENNRLRFLPFGAICFGFVVVAIFLPSAAERIARITTSGVPFSFYTRGYTPEYQQKLLGYNREVFSGSVQSKLSAIQARVPAGEPFGAWIMTPFLLDFTRNPIFPAEPAGISMGWAGLPANVRYFILEYQGTAVRSERGYIALANGPGRKSRVSAILSWTFLTTLKDRAKTSELVYADDSYLLMKFNHP